jgi:hypothetical protein
MDVLGQQKVFGARWITEASKTAAKVAAVHVLLDDMTDGILCLPFCPRQLGRFGLLSDSMHAAVVQDPAPPQPEDSPQMGPYERTREGLAASRPYSSTLA